MDTTEAYAPTIIGQVSYNGCTMTYTRLGTVAGIDCREGNAFWPVASSLVENTDEVWQKILAEAGQ